MGVYLCVLHVQRDGKGALLVILEVPESSSPTLIPRPGLQHGFRRHAGQPTVTPKPKGKEKKRNKRRLKSWQLKPVDDIKNAELGADPTCH